MSDGHLWSGLEFVKVLDTLGLVALRRTLVYDYGDFSFIHRMYYFILSHPHVFHRQANGGSETFQHLRSESKWLVADTRGDFEVCPSVDAPYCACH